jgi:hypothetical protein
VLVVLAPILALTLAGSGASGPQPLAIAHVAGDIQGVVEQESPDWRYASNVYNAWRCTHDEDGTEHPDTCVHNPTPCTWDADDHDLSSGFGSLERGASASASICSIADGYDNSGGDDKGVDVWLWSPQRTLTVALTDNLGHAWTAVPTVERNGWRYAICYREREVGPFPELAGTNGGTGIRIDYTLTVSAARKTNGIGAYFQTWGWLRDVATGCPNPYQPG